jgi:hypothetical protein
LSEPDTKFSFHILFQPKGWEYPSLAKQGKCLLGNKFVRDTIERFL